jgi:hypothetical protein
MRNRDLLSSVAMASSLVACSSSSPQAPDAATDGATDAAWITGNGLVLENTTGSTATPLPGAHVCILDHAEIPCATTDATGAYTLTVPPTLHDVDFAVNVTAVGHLGFTGLMAKGAIPERWYSRISVDIPTDAVAAQLLLPGWDLGDRATGTGLAELLVGDGRGGRVAGIRVDGLQAVYLNAAGAPDHLLTATTTDGRVLFGNVAPGRFEIGISGAPCVVSTGRTGAWDDAWHTANTSTIAGEVAADSLTMLNINCD